LLAPGVCSLSGLTVARLWAELVQLWRKFRGLFRRSKFNCHQHVRQLGTIDHPATIMREVITASACVLSHLTSVLNSFAGPASFMIGSSSSLTELERIT